MKFETLILRGLFVACMLVCGLILAAMVTSKPTLAQLADTTSITSLLTSPPSSCALPVIDDMICVRASI
ncbi:hypothetical protein [Dyella nitratireducens]|uniref:Uncharacterized protein n=1 Tax=Dyella nitratireducens TaxID=1849580 RepID=A0ABQ1FTW2_9GAMM|nr:hypothetical protein [Dyella nitratireducens]GGA28315.1 hypothetical protein GCM10010981_16340 [Dyella nitratireducens]GLQ43302.1 hypothetical protein GCM10007902_31520 [Dyella nitratireducens]